MSLLKVNWEKLVLHYSTIRLSQMVLHEPFLNSPLGVIVANFEGNRHPTLIVVDGFSIVLKARTLASSS